MPIYEFYIADKRIAAGEVIEIDYPFVREKYQDFDEGGRFERMTWRPGVETRERFIYPDGMGVHYFAHGVGKQILTVVDIHKPGRFPARVFFTRKWRDPNGWEFGKDRLHIWTAEKFRRFARGYKDQYRVETDLLAILATVADKG